MSEHMEHGNSLRLFQSTGLTCESSKVVPQPATPGKYFQKSLSLVGNVWPSCNESLAHEQKPQKATVSVLNYS